MKLPGPLHVLNEGMAFVLELAALAALAWWGWGIPEGLLLRLSSAFVAPAAAALLWGLFASPKARVTLPLAGVLAVKALVFGAAAVALHGLGRSEWAVAFALVALLNTTLASMDRRAAMHRGG
ncbi:YrdB family protein [Streptomyces sp. NPDC058877]|uniref:YrdB family protein n=1 Tax=unclassified Streptomyces TaxID=2593676 RepID=UPI00369EF7F6